MSSQGAEQLSFDFLPHLPVVVQRSEGQLSSDAGLLPLRQFDQRWKYTTRMADCLHDPKPSRDQSLLSMLRQRLFGILAGYEDCPSTPLRAVSLSNRNDHDTLRDDPVFKLIADRLPEDKPLASQPTLSRFENLATPAVLQKLIDFTIDTGIERLKQKHGEGKASAGQREYDHYIQRGESEYRMDELKNGLKMDRLSCHRFMANFFRLLLHTAAMNLLNATRDDKSLPEVLRAGQPCTWRTHVIKVAAVIEQSTRRILVKLAAHWPWWPMYHAVGRRSLSFSCGP